MSKYRQFDIILVNYPFSDDPTQTKIRPALIVGNDASSSDDDDYLCCPITSTFRRGEFGIKLTENDLSVSLKIDSELRCNKIYTIRENLIFKKISTLKPQKHDEVIETIISAIEVS
jgi:mRNA interferase MazF